MLVINANAKSATYPNGYTKTYRDDGVLRDQDDLSISGQIIVTSDGSAPFRVGTRDFGSWFQVAVAVYGKELTPHPPRGNDHRAPARVATSRLTSCKIRPPASATAKRVRGTKPRPRRDAQTAGDLVDALREHKPPRWTCRHRNTTTCRSATWSGWSRNCRGQARTHLERHLSEDDRGRRSNSTQTSRRN